MRAAYGIVDSRTALLSALEAHRRSVDLRSGYAGEIHAQRLCVSAVPECPANHLSTLGLPPQRAQSRTATAVHNGLAAELYNILAFYLTLSPGIAPALVACVLWVLVFLQYRNSFNGVLAARPAARG